MENSPNFILPFSEKGVLWAWGERAASEKVFSRCSGRRDYLLSFHLQLLWKYFYSQTATFREIFLGKGIPMIILFLSLISYKSLEVVKNKLEKTTLNQHLTCVDLWRCSSGTWGGWTYCIFPSWGWKGQKEWAHHTSFWFLTSNLNIHSPDCIHK